MHSRVFPLCRPPSSQLGRPVTALLSYLGHVHVLYVPMTGKSKSSILQSVAKCNCENRTLTEMEYKPRFLAPLLCFYFVLSSYCESIFLSNNGQKQLNHNCEK